MKFIQYFSEKGLYLKCRCFKTCREFYQCI